LPIISCEVKPVPTTMTTRCGARARRVAVAPAVATTWRSRGVSTERPSVIDEVRSAERASTIQGSAKNDGESKTKAWE
jgi:hypothetical protein